VLAIYIMCFCVYMYIYITCVWKYSVQCTHQPCQPGLNTADYA